jgi:hypothetical protein
LPYLIIRINAKNKAYQYMINRLVVFPEINMAFLVENYLLPLIPPLLYETTALVK